MYCEFLFDVSPPAIQVTRPYWLEMKNKIEVYVIIIAIIIIMIARIIIGFQNWSESGGTNFV